MTHPPPTFTVDDLVGGIPNVRDPAPSYQAGHQEDIWARWAAVDRANRRVTEIQLKLAELEPELQSQTKEFERMKEKSTKLFESLHGKSRSFVPNALKRIHSGSSAKEKASKDTSRQDFEVAHREETSMLMKVESLREKSDSLNKQMQQNMGLASEVDQVFELLAGLAATSIPNSHANVIAAEQRHADASAAYEMSQTLVTDLLRARVTVQHAHHYHHDVLKTMDAVRGTALGRVVVGGLGEVSKNRDYQVAADTSGKAQICFNETTRVLTPHMSIIPEDIIPDFERLKDLGLLQATKIYRLMYGWKSNTSGDVGKSVKLMLQKQETVFVCLTHLAVWVQKEVPIAEAGLLAARASRDQARRDLVAAWKARVIPEEVSTS